MNKRGITVKFLVGLVIAASILIALFVFTSDSFGKTNDYFNLIFPNTNTTHNVESELFLRYHPIEENLEWSQSGTQWNSFGGRKVLIDGKEIDSQKLLSDFQIYYQQRRDSKEAVLSNNAWRGLFGKSVLDDPNISPELKVVFNTMQFNKDDFNFFDFSEIREAEPPIQIGFVETYRLEQESQYYNRWPIVYDRNGKIFFGDFAIGKGPLQYVKIEENDIPEDYNLISQTAEEFENSIFENPIEIRDFGSFETEKIGDYIVVRIEE